MSKCRSEQHRIHYLSDFEEPDEIAGYRCRRCGQQCLTREGCYDHRSGFLSECLFQRLQNWNPRSADTGADQEADRQ